MPIRYDPQPVDGRWQLPFDFNHQAWLALMAYRLGRTGLVTNRMHWTAEQAVAAYSGQQRIERVFRGLQDGDWLGWGPVHHWTGSKIRIHAFYCMPGVSLVQSLHRKSQTVWPGLDKLCAPPCVGNTDLSPETAPNQRLTAVGRQTAVNSR